MRLPSGLYVAQIGPAPSRGVLVKLGAGKTPSQSYRLALAAGTLRAGRPADCIKELEQAGQHATINPLLAVAHLQLGDRTQARKHLDLARQWLANQEKLAVGDRKAWDVRLECEVLCREVEKALTK